MWWRIAGVLLLALTANLAGSQPPVPRSGPHPPAPDRHSDPERLVAQSAVPGSATPAPIVVPSRQAAEHDAQEKVRGSAIELIATYINTGSTAVMAVFSWLIWLVTREQKNLSRIAVEATEAIERAYVTLSHKPPGADISSIQISGTGQSYDTQDVTIRMVVRNWGNTPGKVSEAFVMPHIGVTLPPLAQWGVNTVPEAAFLVPKKGFGFNRTFALRTRDIQGVKAGEKRLWFLGYVDYADRFGKRHRSLYARRYIPRVDTRSDYQHPNGKPRGKAWKARNNLWIETKDGYNDDRPRQEGEGRD
jgi:hypothetical protein